MNNIDNEKSETINSILIKLILQPPTEGCGADIGCYRFPVGCLPEDCEFLLTFKPIDDVVEFNISVSVDGEDTMWAAVGFSMDPRMVDV